IEGSVEHELLDDWHPEIEATILGHVAPGASRPEPRIAAIPRRLSRVGAKEAEHDTHRRRLPGAVSAEEPADSARRHGERHAVQGSNGTKPLRQPFDHERHPRLLRLSTRFL